MIDASIKPYYLHALMKRWLDFKNMEPWSNFAPVEVKQHLYSVVLLGDIMSAAKEHKAD